MDQDFQHWHMSFLNANVSSDFTELKSDVLKQATQPEKFATLVAEFRTYTLLQLPKGRLLIDNIHASVDDDFRYLKYVSNDRTLALMFGIRRAYLRDVREAVAEILETGRVDFKELYFNCKVA